MKIRNGESSRNENGNGHGESPSEPYVVRVNLTPAMAKEFLLKTMGNRSLSKAHVKYLADEITHGRFVLTGTPVIHVHKNGLTVNGHHVCEGVILAGKTVRVDIAYGLSDEAVSAIDMNRPRSLADVLKMMLKMPNAGKMASYIKASAALLLNTTDAIIKNDRQYIQWLPLFEPALEWALTAFKTRKYAAPTIAAFIVAYKTNPEITKECAARLHSGDKGRYGQNDPAWRLREENIKLKTRKATPTGGAGRKLYSTIAFNALFAAVEQRPIRSPNAESDEGRLFFIRVYRRSDISRKILSEFAESSGRAAMVSRFFASKAADWTESTNSQ